MMLKIFNIELIDCSSSINVLYPSPESRLLLLDIITKLCESECVTNIVDFELYLQFENPDKNGIREYTFKSPIALLYKKISKADSRTFFLQDGENALTNKTIGLYIAPENARNYSPSYNYLKLPEGFRGLTRAFEIVKSLFSGNNRNIPTYMNNRTLIRFRISVGVVWKAWSILEQEPNIELVQSGETDTISADTQDMTVFLGGICVGGHEGRENGDKHYGDIQKVLNKYCPEYTIKEMGESPSNADGRRALYKEIGIDHIEELEPPNIYYGLKINPDEKKILIELHKLIGPIEGIIHEKMETYYSGFLTKNEHIIKLKLISPNLYDLPKNFVNLAYLRELKLICGNLKSLPENLGNLPSLKTIKIEQCNSLISLPKSLENLNLNTLEIAYCEHLESVHFHNDPDGIINYLKKFNKLMENNNAIKKND